MGGREHRLDPTVIDTTQPVEDTSPEAILFAESSLTEEQAEEVMRALDELPEVQKALVECVALGGMTKAGAAGLLGISPSYAYQLWGKALKRLADELNNLFV